LVPRIFIFLRFPARAPRHLAARNFISHSTPKTTPKTAPKTSA
jgi:hypothetical protein